MSDSDDQGTIKKDPEIRITNKIIIFWSQVLQIANICDIGKYVELKRNRYSFWMIWASLPVALVLSVLSSRSGYGNLSISFLIGAPALIGFLYWLERRSPKKYCFRIRMNGGQIHYIFSNDEEFVDKLVGATRRAMEDNTAPITFIGNIDNSSIIRDSNINVNSKVEGSYNKTSA